MIEFIDRVPSPNMANKKTIEYADGRVETVTITSADNANPIGTPMNRANLMAIQGFVAETIVFNSDGSITKTNSNGETLTIRFDANGSITKTFVGKKTITLTISFDNDGKIVKTLS